MTTARVIPLALATALLSGCVGPQMQQSHQFKVGALPAGALARDGIAFMTPSTVTGQEQDRQTLALVFSEVLGEARPEIRQLPVSDTLSAVNRGGFDDDYRRMYTEYRDTGVLGRDGLRRLAELAGVRYVGQLKLANFAQEQRDRFGAFGLRLIQTMQGKARLFLQIWDSNDGSIVWEGVDEVSYSFDSVRDHPVTFRTVLREAGKELARNLP